MNKVFLLGRLGKDPELKRSQSGTAFCNFSIATTERKKEGDAWVEYTEWHSITTFGKIAENCAQYLKKGSQVAIEGSIRTRKWENKDGETRYSTEIVGSTVEFVANKNAIKEDDSTKSVNKKEQNQTQLELDDVPF